MSKEKLVRLMSDMGLTLSVAESLTGGLISASIVSVPGASKVFKEGFICYDPLAKIRTLNVPGELIELEGTVCDKTARLMALGASKKAGTDAAIASTGVAGPDTSEGKPVGLTYVAAVLNDKLISRELHLDGNRDEIRNAAAFEAIELMCGLLEEYKP